MVNASRFADVIVRTALELLEFVLQVLQEGVFQLGRHEFAESRLR